MFSGHEVKCRPVCIQGAEQSELTHADPWIQRGRLLLCLQSEALIDAVQGTRSVAAARSTGKVKKEFLMFEGECDVVL